MFTHPHMYTREIFFLFKFMTDSEFFRPNINVNVWGSYLKPFVAGGTCRACSLRWTWIKTSECPFIYFWPYISIRQCVLSLMGRMPSYMRADEISAWNRFFFFPDMSKWLTKYAKDVLKKASVAILFFLESFMSSKLWQTGCWTWIGWIV